MYQSTVLSNKTQIKSDFLEENIWNLLDNTFSIPKFPQFYFYEVSEDKYIGRPDLISLDAYGDTMFWDIICKLNGISNPFELNIGTMLVLPDAADIDQFAKRAPINELEKNFDKDGNIETQAQKRKTDIRQTNEAIVGDTRFKIDKNKGIVIY